MMTKRTLKRLLAIAMTLSMTISLLNLTAFAAYTTGTDSPASVSLKEGEETDLSVIPGEQVTEQVPGEQVDVASWESQDEAVATVDETGKLTAQSAGTTTVTWIGYYFNPTEEGAEHSYYQLDDPRPGNTDGTKVTISWSITVEKETTPPNSKLASNLSAKAVLKKIFF